MSSSVVRVLLVGTDESGATDLATMLERTAGALSIDLSVQAVTDPANATGDVDCVVCATTTDAADETLSALREQYPTTPTVCYLDGTLSRGHLTTLEADRFVGRAGEDSLLVLADTITNLSTSTRSDGDEQITASIERIDEAMFALDTDWHFTYLNDRAEQLLEASETELLGQSVWKAFPSAVGSTFYDEYHTAVQTGEPRMFEATYEPLGRHFEVAAYPDEDGLVVYVRDVTDSKRQEEALSSVLETTRALMQGRTRTEVGEFIANAVSNTLGFEYCVVRVYNADEGTLEPVGWSQGVEDDLRPPPTYSLDEDPVGPVFANGEAEYVSDRQRDPEDIIASALHLPVGVHGTISIGSSEVDAFDDVDRQLAEILATNAAVAFSRAKREQEVTEARERVETLLQRINGLVQNILEVLVTATTREEIESGVCASMTAADPYAFAWIGTADITGETLTASTWDGESTLDISAYECDLTAGETLDPSAVALQSRSQQVVKDLSHGESDWERNGAAAGFESLCAVPLRYKDTVYGVLTVYAETADAFDEREQVVLEALGRAIGDAINAVERGRILTSNRVIEMELTSRDPSLLFSRLSAQGECRIESTGSLYQSDGELRLYLSADTSDPESLQAVLDDDPDIIEYTHIVTHDKTSLFEVSVRESVVERLADFGAVTNQLLGEKGTTTMTIELPHEAEARDIYDLLAEQYDDLELVGYHEHDRPVQTRQEFRAALRERFTDRQETALRSAYLGGFFEWPREVDGDDLSQAMGITRPTYHQHLRTAERKVFEELFE